MDGLTLPYAATTDLGPVCLFSDTFTEITGSVWQSQSYPPLYTSILGEWTQKPG